MVYGRAGRTVEISMEQYIDLLNNAYESAHHAPPEAIREYVLSFVADSGVALSGDHSPWDNIGVNGEYYELDEDMWNDDLGMIPQNWDRMDLDERSDHFDREFGGTLFQHGDENWLIVSI
jgi:hypothetical protein